VSGFAGEGHAKRFFVEQVLKQARLDRIALSPAEEHMLGWSESDPDFVANTLLVEQLADEISDEEYETKIAGLLERGYRREVSADSSARERYRTAYATLTRGDHYIVVMIRRAIGRHLRPWWAFWR
jgi:hypothetical protein